MKQRILVLGASGFIGKHVVAALARSDWAMPISAGRRRIVGDESAVQIDATDAAQLEGALQGADGVVNCVAGSNNTLINGARSLFEVATRMPGPPRVVHLSSMAVYGEAVGEVEEKSSLDAALSPYGAAKLQQERLAAGNGSVVILRLGVVYGPDSSQWSGRIAQLLKAHRLGDLGSAGDGYSNLVYVGDAADAVLRGLRAPNAVGKTFNIAMPDPPTWNEYFMRYAQALGAVPLSRISKRRLRIEAKLLAPPLKIAEIAVGKLTPRFARAVPQAMPPSLLRLFKQEIRLNVGQAQRELGLDWTPLEEGLRRTVEWYRSH